MNAEKVTGIFMVLFGVFCTIVIFYPEIIFKPGEPTFGFDKLTGFGPLMVIFGYLFIRSSATSDDAPQQL